jgi:23S rRNA (cytosine1962-C5)-methyltransferase
LIHHTEIHIGKSSYLYGMEKNKPAYPILSLIKGKEGAVKRFHPWIFSGAIKQIPKNIEAGSLVYVSDFQDIIIGTGMYETDTIAVKLLDFKETEINEEFWNSRLASAYSLRKSLGLTSNANTTAYRLVHSEGDQLPGLIVDIYGATAVIQTQTTGMSLHVEAIRDAVLAISENTIDSVFWKKPKVMTGAANQREGEGYLTGNQSNPEILENGMHFYIDIETGQKTGFFLDQRDNRLLLKSLSAGRRVLNTFSYSGGFSVAALLGGAKNVVSVDSSQTAIDLCDKNILLNGFGTEQHTSVTADAKRYLQEMPDSAFDLMVLDPPAFAKNHHNRHKGLLGYKFINWEAIRKIAPGGLLFTFSCSQAIDPASFQSIVMAAAIEAGRKVKILYTLSQPPDHPVSIFHPEGAYLKGLVLEVE